MRIALLALVVVAGCATTKQAERPDPARLRKQMASVLLSRRAWGAAMDPLREVVRLAPKDADARVMLGTAYREQGLFEEAEQEFAAALAIDPRRADAYNGRGVLRDLRGDAGDEAITDLKRAVDIAPQNAAFYNNLGFALYVRGRDLDAIEAYRKGLQRDPTIRRMRNNLGFAYGRLGQFNHAKREFYRGGPPAEAENNLGFVYERAGDLVSACDRYREAARLSATLPAVQANLARACGAAEAAATIPAATPREAPVENTPSKRRTP